MEYNGQWEVGLMLCFTATRKCAAAHPFYLSASLPLSPDCHCQHQRHCPLQQPCLKKMEVAPHYELY